jgi:hypothetical protein
MAETHSATDVRIIVYASLLSRVVTAVLLFCAHLLVPTWDKDGRLLLQETGSPAFLEPLLRWDTLHFSRIALDGYTQEKDYAFAPGVPGVMRLGAQLSAWTTGASRSLGGPIVFGSLLAASMSTVAAVLLYKCFAFPLIVCVEPGPEMIFPNPQIQALAAAFERPPLFSPFGTSVHLPARTSDPRCALHRTLLRSLHFRRDAGRLSSPVHRCGARILRLSCL